MRKVIFIKLASLDDLARYVCNYDYTSSAVISVKHGAGYRLFAAGEEVCKSTLAYYINTAGSERAISYTYPSSVAQRENSHFTSDIKPEQGSLIRIISISSAEMKEASVRDREAPLLVMLASSSDLIGAVLLQAAGTETIPYMYSFAYKDKRILCAFDAIDGLSGDNKVLYYALLGRGESGSFARYKYSDNKIDFTEYMGEHSYMYAKIINLAEPFPFFKMPD